MSMPNMRLGASDKKFFKAFGNFTQHPAFCIYIMAKGIPGVQQHLHESRYINIDQYQYTRRVPKSSDTYAPRQR